MTSRTFTARPGCKLNLYLDILRRRSDGYHDVVTVMEPLRLFDRLHFEERGRGIRVDCDHPGVPSGRDNIVWSAADLFRKKTGIRKGIRIRIEKNVPAAAGLGGGSADAAAVLKTLNRRWKAGLSPDLLRSLAARLGSDVPFFIRPRTCLSWGRGERLSALPPMPRFWAVLVKPAFGVSTAWAYSRIRCEALGAEHPHLNQILAALNRGDLEQIAACFFNVFEPVIRRRHPEVGRLLDFLRAGPVLGALLAGSGPTVAGVVRDRGEAELWAGRVRGSFPSDWRVMVVTNRPLPKKRSSSPGR